MTQSDSFWRKRIGADQASSRLYVVGMLFINTGLLIASWYVSAEFRSTIPIGSPKLNRGELLYEGLPLLLIVAIVAVIFIITLLGEQWLTIRRLLGVHRQFRQFMISLVGSTVFIAILARDVSWIQLGYYAAVALLYGTLLILFPGRIRQQSGVDFEIVAALRQLYKQRFLIFLWMNYRIRRRYSQTILGIAWIVLLPIAQSAVLAFAFSQLLGARSGDTPFVVFLLSGSVIYGIFGTTVGRSTSVVVGMSNITEQVYFPREILLLLLIGEILIDYIFTFIALVVISLLFGVYPNIYFMLLPIPVIFMIALSLGIGFFLAWASIVVRDLQQLTNVLLQLVFYSTVLFNVDRVGPNLAFLPAINPVSGITEAFRSIVLYSRQPDWWQFIFPSVLAVVLLYFGYIYYKVNEDRFADFT
jgi:ABC-type polysaccharide/polyol phosphate export permease